MNPGAGGLNSQTLLPTVLPLLDTSLSPQDALGVLQQRYLTAQLAGDRREALRLLVDEVSRLQRERVFERELSDAQAYLAGSFPLTIETPNDTKTSSGAVSRYSRTRPAISWPRSAG